MPRAAAALLPLLLAPLALAGCPARVGGPPAVGDFAVSGDLSMMRFDLSVPDLAPGADLAKPAGDASVAMMDAARVIDLPATIDAPGDAPAGPDGAANDLATLPDLACLPLASFTNARGFANGNDIGLQPNMAVNAVANQTVTITVWTTPSGANPGVHAVFATNAQFMNQQDMLFTFDAKPQGNPPPNGTDQWFVVLPAQPVNTHVWVYLRADSCDKKSMYLPGNANYEYIAK